VKIADITRMNGMTHSHFYAYFRSLDEVVMTLARQVSICPPSLISHAQQDWTGPDGMSHVRRLVEEFFAVWREHREILQVTRLIADEIGGDFLNQRFAQFEPLFAILEAKVKALQASTGTLQGADPAAVAFKLIILLASAGNDYGSWQGRGFSDEELVETTAKMLHLLATGGAPSKMETPAPAP
jgi:AcrR family transcriptional regulator